MSVATRPSPSSIRRCTSRRFPEATAEQQERARRLLSTEIGFVPNASFRRQCVEDTLPTTTAESQTAIASHRGRGSHVARLGETPLLTAEQERALFRRMNYLKYRANVLRTKLDVEQLDVSALETAEAFLREATEIRNQIVRANMRLVMKIVKPFASHSLSFDELVSDGVMTLLRAVEKFDFDRGFRFSTYAYRAIARTATQAAGRRAAEASRFVTLADDASGLSILDDGYIDEQSFESLRKLVGELLLPLDSRERLIISARFRLGTDRPGTFQALADELGLSKERIRQLEQKALAKLHATAVEKGLEQYVDSLGDD